MNKQYRLIKKFELLKLKKIYVLLFLPPFFNLQHSTIKTLIVNIFFIISKYKIYNVSFPPNFYNNLIFL